MKPLSWERCVRLFVVVFCLMALSFGPLTAQTEEAKSVRTYFERGVASTGLNRVQGLPIWTYPNLEGFVPIFGDGVQLIGISTMGAFDPALGVGAGNSQSLSPATPMSTPLASYVDNFGLSFVGVSPGSVPAEALNLPLDEVDVLVGEDGVERASVPCADRTSDPKAITRAGPCSESVSLGRWLQARGISRIRCFADGSAEVILIAKRLLPHRMYTVWYLTENFEAGPEKFLQALPFGGVPNLFITDQRGNGVFSRDLGYCPQDQEQALGYFVVLRSNGQNYGGVPAPFLNQEDQATAFAGFAGLVPGTVAHVHLGFNLNGVPFDPTAVP